MVYDNEGMMNDAKRKESRIYEQEWKIDEWRIKNLSLRTICVLQNNFHLYKYIVGTLNC